MATGEVTKVTARLEQLTCPECANLIAKVIGKLPGVSEAEVRFTTSKLLVAFDPQVTAWAAIEQAVQKLGYQVLSTTTGK